MRDKIFLVGILLLSFVFSSVTSCATSAIKFYEGPKKHQSELALLCPQPPLIIISIDDLQANLQLVKPTDTLQILPGKHTVTVKYDDGFYKSIYPITLDFIAVAGKSYKVYFPDPNELNAIIEEQ